MCALLDGGIRLGTRSADEIPEGAEGCLPRFLMALIAYLRFLMALIAYLKKQSDLQRTESRYSTAGAVSLKKEGRVLPAKKKRKEKKRGPHRAAQPRRARFKRLTEEARQGG